MEFIAEALASVSESQRELVALLYGFDGQRRTPEEIREKCRLTPAKIEQTVKTVMRRMRHPACAGSIREGLVSADEQIWGALAGPAGIVYKSEALPRVRSRLPGELCFAIESQYGSVENWLSRNTRSIAKGWYRSRFAEGEIEAIIRRFAAEAGPRLPLPIESLARSMSVEAHALETAIRLGDDFRLYWGYAAAFPLGTRAPRAIRLHRILAGAHAGDMVPARRLLSDYRSEFANDACTLRDAETAMISFPHLFLRSGDLGWSGIGAAGGQRSGGSEDDVTFHRWSEERKSGEEIADWAVIRQILEEHGPCRTHQIQRLFRAHSNAEIRLSSVNVYLGAHDEFMRLAPGVYGLSEWDAGMVELAASAHLLLNRGACLQYVLARWAGEPADSYPLWTPGMEAEWCEWAQVREKQLLGSLLAVVDPSSWSAPDSYRAVWLWKKECLGYFRFEKPPRYPLAGATLLDLLAVLKCARWRGAANWVLANRVTGQRILNRDAASFMALLIGLKALEPAVHWQRPHVVSAAGASEVEAMLSEELHRKGSLAWSGASGQALLKRLADTIDRGETGWVARFELQRLFDLLRDS